MLWKTKFHQNRNPFHPRHAVIATTEKDVGGIDYVKYQSNKLFLNSNDAIMVWYYFDFGSYDSEENGVVRCLKKGIG